jgi:hypothetical protein
MREYIEILLDRAFLAVLSIGVGIILLAEFIIYGSS